MSVEDEHNVETDNFHHDIPISYIAIEVTNLFHSLLLVEIGKKIKSNMIKSLDLLT